MKHLLIIITGFFIGSIILNSCKENRVSNKLGVDSIEILKATRNDNQYYLDKGKELAMLTKTSLAKHLLTAINNEGIDGAVAFCNTKAIPITDSMSTLSFATIKRVSDQPRNAKNLANNDELSYIKKWKENVLAGKEQSAVVKEIDENMVGYYPITINQMCLGCHGQPKKDINTVTLKKIRSLYPTDQATGYSINEIRGIFVVTMQKNKL